MNGLPGRPWSPTKDLTYCNYFVHGVCRALGYGQFTHNGTTRPMLANEMIDFISDSKNGWIKVEGEVAQYHANAGVLVIAGKKEDDHGHVCIVRPGEFQFSPQWGKKSPRVANIGKSVFIDHSCSYAFVNEPDFFALTEMI